ncbi:MAG: phosphoglucosamine mutase, partial [Chloroflexi bacterium]|nr:phosphoglucosamine mutase [Chloroflexota bacterium]
SRPLSELRQVMRRLPQVLVNVMIKCGSDIMGSPRVIERIEAAEGRLGETGRILVRPSGTESLARVMVEAPTDEEARRVAEEIARVIEAEFGY